MSRSFNITRKIISERRFNVFTMNNNQLTQIGTISCTGKPSLKEIAKKFNVDKVFIDCYETVEATYAMNVNDFMNHAFLIDEKII